MPITFTFDPIITGPVLFDVPKATNPVKPGKKPEGSSAGGISSDVPIPELTTGSFHSLKTDAKSRWNKIKSSYPTVDDKGVNGAGATPAQTQLARIASKVAEDMDTKGYCYSGVKHALWTAGLIKDYAAMPAGDAPAAIKYFETHTETFEEIKDVKPEDIKNLKAGTIIVFQKPGEIGHIGIANGKGQLYSDCTDPGTWHELKGGTKAGASYRIFKIKDDLAVNPKTGKIEHPSPEKKEGNYLDSSI